MNAEELW